MQLFWRPPRLILQCLVQLLLGRLSFCAIIGIAWFAPKLAAQDVSFSKVAYTGDVAPSAVPNSHFYRLLAGVINDSGDVAFIGSFIGGSGTTEIGGGGVWSGKPGALTNIAKRGDIAPGSGIPFGDFGPPLINSVGKVVFSATYSNQIVRPTGYWGNTGGALGLVVLQEGPIPSAPAGSVYSRIDQPAISDGATAAFGAAYSPSIEGIYVRRGTTSSLVAKDGMPIPGFTPPSTFLTPNRLIPAVTGQGTVYFVGGVNTPSSGVYGSAIFSQAPTGAYSIEARSGQQAPGLRPGTVFSDFGSFTVNDRGDLAFYGSLIDPEGLNFSTYSSIWARRFGNLELVARSSMQAPGLPAGVTYDIATNVQVALNSRGNVAFLSSVLGDSIGATKLWSDGNGTMRMIASEMETPPGVESSSVLGRIRPPILSPTGQVAFEAALHGPLINTT